MPDQFPVMWANGNELGLVVDSASGPLYSQMLPMTVLLAQVSGGEIFRFTYDSTDPETGEATSGAARIVIEQLPDPRTLCATCGAARGLHGPGADHAFIWKTTETEEQPPAADATAPEDQEDEESEGEPIMRPMSGFDLFVMDKYMPTRDSGGIPLLPPYTPPAP